MDISSHAKDDVYVLALAIVSIVIADKTVCCPNKRTHTHIWNVLFSFQATIVIFVAKRFTTSSFVFIVQTYMTYISWIEDVDPRIDTSYVEAGKLSSSI